MDALSSPETGCLPNGSRRPRRVLLVDADARAGGRARELLALDGHVVAAFRNAEEALARAAECAPDLIVLDLELPGLTGFEAIAALRGAAATAGVPILAMSARRDARSRAAAFASGADCFVAKPPVADELRAAVASLASRERRREDGDDGSAIVASLAEVVCAAWGDARRHLRRSARLARAFGALLGVDEASRMALERAGWLHDVGKVGVPSAILDKPGPLTPAERRVMERHPLLGARICAPLQTLDRVVPIVRHHHEWFDGSGYPWGLSGDDIPWLARVFQVADVYEALTSERCYKAALSRRDALAVLAAESAAGKWDPDLVAAFTEFAGAGLLEADPGE